jgi:hypothetical protein
MQMKAAIPSLTILVLMLAGSSQQGIAQAIEHSMILPSIGSPARTHNPACQDGLPPLGPLVARMVYEAADSYIGVPFTSAVMRTFPELDAWFQARAGLHDGRASCGVVCLTVPSTGYRVGGCLDETMNTNGSCQYQSGDAVRIGWGRIDQIAIGSIQRGKVVCVFGKNHSHDRHRRIIVNGTPIHLDRQLVGDWRCVDACAGTTFIRLNGSQLQVKNEGPGAPWHNTDIFGHRVHVNLPTWPVGTLVSMNEINWNNGTRWVRP